MGSFRTVAIVVALTATLAFVPAETRGSLLDDILAGDIKANAKTMEYVGDNIILRGDVKVKYQDMVITGDKAVVNMQTKDLEAVGNIKFIKRQTDTETVSMDKLEKLKRDFNAKVSIEGYVTSASGRRRIEVNVTRDVAVFKAKRVSGNLSSGVLEFKGFVCQVGTYFILGASASRDSEGIITVKDAKLSTCEYIVDDQEHYSITAGEVKVYPPHLADINNLFGGVFGKHHKKPESLSKTSLDQGDHTIYAYNCTFRVGGVPVFWSPILYKPDEPSSLGFQVQAGYDSEWGMFLLASKKFRVMTDPAVIETTPHVDLYSKRGFGYGDETTIRTRDSYTEIFGYGIYDNEPYGPDDKDDDDFKKINNRLSVPHYRYDLRLSHLNHITPRLDFRGHVEKLSDINFLQDFFVERSENDPQPATFANLEYQGDRFIASISARPRTNDFFTVVERLPEIRLDIPRQELWNNIYYQGETSFNNFYMRWRDFDNPRTAGNGVDPKDYSTMRIDTLHMFYYPLKFDWLNVIPRGGLRLTDYTRTSSEDIDVSDLETMFIVDAPDGNPEGNVVNYKGKQRNRLRFAGEVGLELNTKIHRSWNNVKNAFFDIDGLRHVFIPYINYTYIPEPSLNRDEIFYFDDVDRIEKMHFIRFGMKNRLQTRRGPYGKEQIYEWASMENYFDFHCERKKEYSHFGDFGTRININPLPGLRFSTEFLMNAGMSNAPNSSTYRGGKKLESAKGISSKYINRLSSTIDYKIMENLRVWARYNFQNNYRYRGVYSMGSSLDTLNSTSSFERNYRRFQTASAGIEFPIPWDDGKTRCALEGVFDLEGGYFRENRFKVIRKLHCWEVAVELAQRRSRNSEGGRETNNSVMFMLYLTEGPGRKVKLRQSPSSRSTASDSPAVNME